MLHAHFFRGANHQESSGRVASGGRLGGGAGSEIVGRLQKSFYGTSDAAANFQKEFKKFMREQGFVVGAYNISIFYHRQRGLRVMVHGGRFHLN